MLTQEILLENFRYDEATGDLYWKVKRASKTDLSKPISCKNKDGYIQVGTKLSGKSKNYVAHRLIWMMVYGTTPKFIDHKDRDRSNNKISNLREATHQQNMQNRKKRADSSSNYKGVRQYGNGWVATFQRDGERCYLGYFKNEIDAANAYKEFAKFTNGEFAANLT
jgi:hypothetical protein